MYHLDVLCCMHTAHRVICAHMYVAKDMASSRKGLVDVATC